MAFFHKSALVRRVSYINGTALFQTQSSPSMWIIANRIPNDPALDLHDSWWSVPPSEGEYQAIYRSREDANKANYLRINILLVTKNSHLAYFLFERSDQWQLLAYGNEPDWPSGTTCDQRTAFKQHIRNSAEPTRWE